jgi:hypothetical protein
MLRHGHGALGRGHGAWGKVHGAWDMCMGIRHGAWGMGHGACAWTCTWGVGDGACACVWARALMILHGGYGSMDDRTWWMWKYGDGLLDAHG